MFDNSQPDRKYIEFKYRIAWYIGTILSFVLYFSGIIPLYVFLFRKCLKRHVAIVLMYHRVGDRKEAPDMTVSIKNFERQMIYLKKNFHIVPLGEIVDGYINNARIEKDKVAITFDDGFKDNYTNAYPVLKKYNVTAAIFIITELIGKDNGLNEDEIQLMHKDNITFGAHTITHKVLSNLNREAAVCEISGSKSDLETIINEKVKYFAYPYGKKGRDFNEETMQIVKETGYSGAFATDNGFITDKSNHFALNRIGVRNFPLFVFKARISGIFENKLLFLLRKIVGV